MVEGTAGRSGRRTYRRGQIKLDLDISTIEATQGRVVEYRYWRAEHGEDGLVLTRFASCLIPDSDEAVDHVWQRFAQGEGPGEVALGSDSGPLVPWRTSPFAAVARLLGPRPLHAAQEDNECSAEDPDIVEPCEIDGIDVPPPNDPTPPPPPPDDPPPPPPPSGCDPEFEECSGGGGTPGGGTPGGCIDPDAACSDDPDFVMDFRVDDDAEEIQEAIDCNNPTHRQAASIDAFCLGTPVMQSSKWGRVDATINRIAARGGACVAIAAKARSLANSGRLRVYDGSHGAGWGSQVHDFAVVDEAMFGTYYYALTHQNAQVPDHGVVHEVEHAMGAGHVSLYGLPAHYNTPNSITCGGGGGMA